MRSLKFPTASGQYRLQRGRQRSFRKNKWCCTGAKLVTEFGIDCHVLQGRLREIPRLCHEFQKYGPKLTGLCGQ